MGREVCEEKGELWKKISLKGPSQRYAEQEMTEALCHKL